MTIEAHLKKRKAVIDTALNACLPPAAKRPAAVHEAMRYAVLGGGKRIRPVLVLESCALCGGTVSAAVPAACAVECVHAYSLIHDDLPAMDDDDLRRGKPTVHRKFGEAVAILAGDALLTLAFEILSLRAVTHGPYRKAAVELARASGTLGMIGGQAADIAGPDKGRDKKLLTFINERKTARLFEASCAIGALVAGAGPGKMRALAAFGKCFGLSFQIVDDIIDDGAYLRRCGPVEAVQDTLDLVGAAHEALRSFGRRMKRMEEITEYILLSRMRKN